MGSFSYTPCAILYSDWVSLSVTHPMLFICGYFLLHSYIPCCFCREFLLCFMLFCAGSFSYTSYAVFVQSSLYCCSLLVHDMCCFMLGISLICTMLLCMGSFLYMPVLFIYLFGDFLWHALCWGVSVGVEGIWGSHACPIMQFYIGSFSYAPHAFNAGNFACTPCAASCGEFLSHTLCCFMWGISVTHPVLLHVGNFCHTPCAASCGEFLSHTLCSFAWGVVAVVTLWSGTMTD